MLAQRQGSRGRANAAALLFLMATLAMPAPRAQAQSISPSQPFAFAGLSLETTRNQLRQLYPQDYDSGNTLDVAPERVQDHIHQIEIATPDGSGRGRLLLSFERRALVSADGRVLRAAGYPRCAEIEKRLKALFGAPTRSDEFIEGDTDGYMNRVLVWERRLPQLAPDQQMERLNLQCGRSKGERRFWAFSVGVARSAR
jgi:hypothetical protein